MDHHPHPLNPLELDPPALAAAPAYVPLWNGLGRTVVGFWVLENLIHWFGVHFIDGRAVPCCRSVAPCAACKACWTPRRTGFVCALRGRTGGRYILRVTEEAFRKCPVLALVGVKLRGTPLLVSRLGETKQAPWSLTVPSSAPRVELPAPANTIKVLSRVWGIDLDRLGRSPPLDGDVTRLLDPYQPKQRRQS